MSTDIKAVVHNWTDCINHYDPDGAAAYVSEDFVFDNVGNGMRIEGRAAFRDDVAQMVTMWTELYIDTTALFVDGDHYTKQWVMTGMHTGDIPGLPATGKPFRIRGCGVGRIDDDKIGELTEYWNMAEFLIQVGILPPPTA